MGVSYTWDDDAKTTLRYTATDPWNWNDYHKAVRMAAFSLHGLEHPVDVIFDLSATATLPGGALAHLRTVGRRSHDALSGRVVIVNLPPDVRDQLAGAGQRDLQLDDRTLYFVDDNAEATTLLKRLR